jgi:hypothetical protein
MVFRVTDDERRYIVAAYREASLAGKRSPDCYVAAIDALHRLHPKLDRALLASAVVRVITSDVQFVTIARSLRKG